MTSYRYVPDGNGGWQAVAMAGPAEGDPRFPDAPGGPLPSPERLLQMQAVNDQLAKQDAGPATDTDRFLSDLHTIGDLAKATVHVADPPQTPAERDTRVIAARQLAASLGYDLRTVPKLSGEQVFDVLTGKPSGYASEIFTLMDAFGRCFPVGPLQAIESELTVKARERAARERAEAKAAERNAERARIQAQALANSPAARLARLEAKLAAAGLPVD